MNQQQTEEQKKKQKEKEERDFHILEQQKLSEELAQKSKPLWISKAFVDKPFIVIGICSIIFLVCLVIYVAADLGEMSDPHDRDYLIWSNERTKDFDMLVQAQEDFQKSISENINIPVRSITNSRWTTYIVLENNEGKNLLTVEGIKMLYKIEQNIINLKDYKNFCLSALDSEACASDALTSFTKLFPDPENLTESQLQAVIDNVTEDEATFIVMKGLFGDKFNSQNKESHLIRSQFKFAGPLHIDGKVYKDIYDRQQEQLEKFDDFSQEIYDFIEELEDNKDIDKPEQIDVFPYSQDMYVLQMQVTTDKDVKWAMGSIVFVLIYLAIHLKSLFLSSMSMLSIILSFPITFVIFKLILSIDYYSSLHVLIVFIVLGISADNVFVFTDAWNQTASYKQLEGDFNQRMAVTFRRASKAMLATSSTTGAAFLATGLSPIMPISSFGFFAGILIPINFILVITFYPAVLIVYEKYTKFMCVRKQKQQQVNNKNNDALQEKIGEQQKQQQINGQQQNIQKIVEVEKNQEENQNQEIETEAQFVKKIQQQYALQNPSEVDDRWPKKSLQTLPSSGTLKNQKNQQDIQKNQKKQDQKVQEKENLVIKLFNNQINTFIFKFRYIIVALFTIWTGISVWRTSQLPSLSAPEQFLEDAHPCQESINLMRNDFHKSGNSNTGISVYQYWGIKKLDKDGVGAWASDELGKVVWDDTFDLSPKQNQQFLYNLCQEMVTSELVQDQQVECFMTNFEQFVKNVKNVNFPVEQNQFLPFLIEFTQDTVYEGAAFYNENQIGIIDGDLKFVVIKFSSPGIPYSPYKELNPIYEKWDDYIDQLNKKAPQGMNNTKQTALVGWVFMITEKAFSSSAVSGTLISLAFAFVVLIIVTHNIIISFFSILTISGIVVSAVCIMELVGWELGVAESVAIVILIGMSVDYVVHLATHYVECSYPDRYRKMQLSLKDLGISIISGATTTMGSGVFLFGAQLVLLQKFAILILVTITFSLLYALVFFSALVHIIGPQGETGNLANLCKKKQQKEVSSSQQTIENQEQKQKQDVENQQK